MRLSIGGVAVLIPLLVGPSLVAQAPQQPDTTVLLVTGDLNKSYHVVNGAFWIEPVAINSLRTREGQWTHAMEVLTRRVMKDIRAANADALIHTQVQFVPLPPFQGERPREGEARGVILIYGTVVSYLPPS